MFLRIDNDSQNGFSLHTFLLSNSCYSMMISHSLLYILDKLHHPQTCKNHKILQDSITQLSAKKASLSMLLPLRTMTLCRVWFGGENFRRKTHRPQRHLCLGLGSRFMREGGRLSNVTICWSHTRTGAGVSLSWST